MKTTGKVKESVIISTSALVLDTVLNALFILVLKMGVKGAALTTTISRVIELIVVFAYTNKMAVKPDMKKISPEINKDFVKCSTPILINALTWGIGTALYSVILGHLGAVVTAANSVASIVRRLATSACRGLSVGGGILLASVLGSGDLIKGKEYGARLAKLSVLCGAVCAAFAFAFGFVLLNFMTLSDAVKYDLKIMIFVSAFYMLGLTVNNVLICGIFATGGDTAFDAYSLAVTMWLIILPLACMAAFWWKLNPIYVYIILSLDEVVKIPWVCAHYKKYKWLKNITRDEV